MPCRVKRSVPTCFCSLSHHIVAATIIRKAARIAVCEIMFLVSASFLVCARDGNCSRWTLSAAFVAGVPVAYFAVAKSLTASC